MMNKLCSLIFSAEECICCGKNCYGIPVCDSCRKKMTEIALNTEVSRCIKCGKLLLSEDNICFSCRDFPVLKNCDNVFPLYSYRLWKKNLLFEWKMNGRRILTDLFADILYKTMCMRFSADSIPAIVPVPPRKGKIKRIGWDQIEDLCQNLQKRHKVRIMRLIERYSSEQQKKNDRYKRLSLNHNFGIRYDFAKWKKYDKIPEEVILLDDVITTGATVEECSLVLKKIAGISRVNVVSLFIVSAEA